MIISRRNKIMKIKNKIKSVKVHKNNHIPSIQKEKITIILLKKVKLQNYHLKYLLHNLQMILLKEIIIGELHQMEKLQHIMKRGLPMTIQQKIQLLCSS